MPCVVMVVKSQRQWLWLYLEAGEEGTEVMLRAQLYHLVYEWFGEREIRGLRQRELKGQCYSGVSERLREDAMEGTSFGGLRSISMSVSSVRLFAGPATDAFTEAVEADLDGLGCSVGCDEPTAGSTGSEGDEGWAGNAGRGWSALGDLAPTVPAVPYFGFVSTLDREEVPKRKPQRRSLVSMAISARRASSIRTEGRGLK